MTNRCVTNFMKAIQLLRERLEQVSGSDDCLEGLRPKVADVEKDIRKALSERGALPLDKKQMYALRQVIICSVNGEKW